MGSIMWKLASSRGNEKICERTVGGGKICEEGREEKERKEKGRKGKERKGKRRGRIKKFSSEESGAGYVSTFNFVQCHSG